LEHYDIAPDNIWPAGIEVWLIILARRGRSAGWNGSSTTDWIFQSWTVVGWSL